MLDRHPHGEGVRRDVSRLHPGRTGGSFEYAHVLSHMSEMGGAGISALYYYYTIPSAVKMATRPVPLYTLPLAMTPAGSSDHKKYGTP